MKKAVVWFILVLAGIMAGAQPLLPEETGQQNSRPEIFQRLNISQDPQIERLVGMHIRKNESSRGIQGYRVEIFFSSALDARQKALSTKTAFLRDFPDINVYVIYISPDFKVRVGDFRTKNEALALMKKVQDRFPKAFIVPDNIEYPSLN
ncbi:MAG: SPOR domain-containing protein [Bacteroidota bacterium]